MVLSGTLQEYILADVFQLLSQQKATGKLLLTSGKLEGFLVLHEGALVAAVDGAESLMAKLQNCLLTVKGVAVQDVQSLAASFGRTPDMFARELVSRQYLGPAEVATLAKTAIEDIGCSLFAWTKGEYHYESLSGVTEFAIPGISIPADSVVMEAMRRIDEIKRIKPYIQNEIIFVPVAEDRSQARISTDIADIISSPDPYILSFIDGLTTVGMIHEKSFLPRFRVIESLFALWESNRIAPLSAKISRSIQAAIRHSKMPVDYSGYVRAALIAGGAIAAAVMLIALLSVSPRFLFPRKLEQSRLRGSEIPALISERKLEYARLHFHARTGTVNPDLSDLTRSGLLSPRDIKPLYR